MLAENVDYGRHDARGVLISLLVDDDVPSRGHRRTLLNARLRVVGAACRRHPRYRQSCVLDFAGAMRLLAQTAPRPLRTLRLRHTRRSL